MDIYDFFSDKNFKDVRTATLNGEPVFCFEDIARAFGFKSATYAKKYLDKKYAYPLPTKVMTKRVKKDGGRVIRTVTKIYLSESGLYDFILTAARLSRKGKKKDSLLKIFSDWVWKEVFTSVTTKGYYITEEKLAEMEDDEEAFLEWAIQYSEYYQKTQEFKKRVSQQVYTGDYKTLQLEGE